MSLFSVIIPFYNAAETLASTLESLRAQTFGDWEAICVDDGSSDASRAIADRFAAQDARIRVYANLGKGPSDARNYAASLAGGDLLAFLDADDLWVPNKLSALATAFEDMSTDALYARIGFFDKSPSDCQTQSSILPRPLCIGDLLAENPVCTLSNLAVRACAFRRIGGFDATISHNEDLDFLIRLIGEGHMVAGLDRVLTWYRASATGLSSDMNAMLESRNRVVQTAALYGCGPTRADEAVYLRYLARRALRLHAPSGEAWAYAFQGLRRHPLRFLTPFRRGAATALAAALVRACPATARLIRT
ncbi:glycosyltransferase family 2 protein [Roseobacteraceae bacterium S113]